MDILVLIEEAYHINFKVWQKVTQNKNSNFMTVLFEYIEYNTALK